jgi:thioredoxin reductase (NADPH)
MAKAYDTIIIGGGPAGYTAALYAARAGLSALVMEMLSPGGQMATTTQIDNYPGVGAGADGFSLGEKMQAQAEQLGAESLFAEVTAVDLNANPKVVSTSDGSYTARTLILATGASPRKLGLPEEESLVGKGVAYCATCDGMFYRGKTVAVLGGGNSAAADALYLSQLCKKVYLVHRRDTLRADASYLKPLEAAQNIEYVWNQQVDAFEHADTLTGLALTDRKTGEKRILPVDGAFVAIGRAPNTALFEGQLTLDEGGYIPAGENTETSVPGVFAAGDVRTKPLRQILTAASDGAVAASQAAAWLRQQ